MTPKWLRSWHPAPEGRPLVVWFPAAGAGAGGYADWQAALGTDIAVLALALPGREQRWADEPAQTVDAVADAVMAELRPVAERAPAVVLIGHSLGGLLAYVVAQRLETCRAATATALVVIACRPPDQWLGDGGIQAAEVDVMLRSGTRRMDDLDDDSRELLLEVLRADIALSQTFVPPPESSVSCAFEAWGGEHDPLVTAEQLAGWRRFAGGDFARRDFACGHAVPDDAKDAVLGAVRSLLGTMATTPATMRGAS